MKIERIVIVVELYRKSSGRSRNAEIDREKVLDKEQAWPLRLSQTGRAFDRHDQQRREEERCLLRDGGTRLDLVRLRARAV